MNETKIYQPCDRYDMYKLNITLIIYTLCIIIMYMSIAQLYLNSLALFLFVAIVINIYNHILAIDERPP